MEIRPILASLRKHRIPTALIVLEIALACAVFCNAVFMISRRVEQLNMPNAIDQRSLVMVNVRGANQNLAGTAIPRNRAALRRIPGVTAVTVTSAVPFGASDGVDSVGVSATSKHRPGAARYLLARGARKTMGLKVLQGRYFNASEYAGVTKSFPDTHVVIVTQALAKRLWHGQRPVGRQLWLSNRPYTVIGVIANVVQPGPPVIGSTRSYDAIFFPASPMPALTHYMLRTTPGNRVRVLRAAIHRMHMLAPHAHVAGETFSNLRRKAFARTRGMVGMLALICVIMLAVTAFGIVGLASFWVSQRHKSVGIRRALGATRGNILRYFQTENFIIVTVGIALGVIVSYVINAALMQSYALPRLPGWYLAIAAVVLWLLGQLAVFRPALRASHVPPAVATRSV